MNKKVWLAFIGANILRKIMALVIFSTFLIVLLPSIVFASSMLLNADYTDRNIDANENAGWQLLASAGVEQGKFGKSVGDFVLKRGGELPADGYEQFTNKAITGEMGSKGDGAGTGPSFSAGDRLIYGFQTAYVKNTLRGARIWCILDNGYEDESFLSVAENGAVTFAGNGRGTISNYRTERWYDYKIIFDFGEENTKASLYIDGVSYGENIILGEGAATKINSLMLNPIGPGSIYTDYGYKLMYPGAGTYTYYVDNFSAIKYVTGEELPICKLDITSSKPDVFVKEDGSIELTGEIAPDELTSSLEINGISTDDYTLTVLSNDFSKQKEQVVSAGYLKIRLSDGCEIYRIILPYEKEVEIFNVDYSDGNMDANANAGWHLVVNAGIEQGGFGKEDGDIVLKRSGEITSGGYEQFLNTSLTGETNSTGGGAGTGPSFSAGDRLIYGFQVAYDQTSLSGARIWCMLDNGYNDTSFLSVANDGTITFAGNSGGKIPNYKSERWYDYKIVFDFGEENTKASLYIDGVSYGENIILGEGAASKINSLMLNPIGPGSIYTDYGYKLMYPSAGIYTYYVDNFRAIKYVDGALLPQLLSDIKFSSPIITKENGLFKTENRIMKVSELMSYVTAPYGGTIEFIKKDVLDISEEIATGVFRLTRQDGSQIFYDLEVNSPQRIDGATDFDIVNLEFTGDNSKIGVRADIYNWRSWEKRSAIMVLTLTDERGAIRDIYFSEETPAYDETGENVLFEISIAPVDNVQGYKAEVFFIDNWDNYRVIKNNLFRSE